MHMAERILCIFNCRHSRVAICRPRTLGGHEDNKVEQYMGCLGYIVAELSANPTLNFCLSMMSGS
jgi:hypothetical protein